MTKYESLLSEYDFLDIQEKKMKNTGLYSDGCIWIKEGMGELRKASVLAEEIGHYETSSGDITVGPKEIIEKQEHIARKWAYRKLVPLDDIYLAYSLGYTKTYEMADYLGVEEAFLKECIKSYNLL